MMKSVIEESSAELSRLWRLLALGSLDSESVAGGMGRKVLVGEGLVTVLTLTDDSLQRPTTRSLQSKLNQLPNRWIEENGDALEE